MKVNIKGKRILVMSKPKFHSYQMEQNKQRVLWLASTTKDTDSINAGSCQLFVLLMHPKCSEPFSER